MNKHEYENIRNVCDNIDAGALATSVVAVENNYNYKCDDYDVAQQLTPEITLYDLAGSEIEIINGLPYIIVETEDGYVNIPFLLSNTMDMMADGVPITVEVDGNYLLIPTEDGIERVCISEFDVELIDGNLMLVHEINPEFVIGGVTVIVGGGTILVIGIAAGAVTSMVVYVGTAILAGRRPTASGLANAAGTGAAGAVLTIIGKFGMAKFLNWLIRHGI